MIGNESMFLSVQDVRILTGYTTRPAQVRALNRMGIDHKVRPDGRVIVLRTHIEKILDNSPISGNIKGKHNEPNWSALAKNQTKRK